MEEFQFKQNELWCEGVNLREIAEVIGTPAYVYSKRSVIDHCRWIERAFGTTDHLSCYAIKANANHTLLRLLATEGIGADAGSVGEIKLALDAGFPVSKITFSGVGKRDDEIEFALNHNIMSLNVESEEELEIINTIAGRLHTTARVLLRVNFDIKSDTHPYITTGRKQNKFGVTISRAREIARRIGSFRSIELIGIHSHIGSQITKTETFIDAAGAIVRFVQELRAFGISLRQINFGGGFGVRYRNYVSHSLVPSEPDDPESNVMTINMIEAILPVLQEAGCTILIQPGRSIVAHAGILMTKVLYRKSSDDKTFIIVDAGMNDLIRPSLYQSYHQIVPLQVKDVQRESVDVVGPLCETGDFFALDRMMPRVERGECLAILCTGAYGYVLSSHYNGRPRPPEVLVDGNTFTMVTEREVLEQL